MERLRHDAAEVSDMDYSTWPTKDQAAAAIGVTPKTLERWAQAGKLQQVSWSPQARGPARVVYHPADIERLVQERRQSPAPFVLPAAADLTAPPNGSNGHGVADLALATVGSDDPLRLLFAAALRAVLSQTSQTSAAVSEKWVLTLAEAAAVSGWPASYLRRCIQDGTLPAVKARGWRIRRRDLEAL